MNRSLLTCLLFLILSVSIVESLREWRKTRVLIWDAAAYYVYLPGAFIHHDLKHLHFYDSIGTKYDQSADVIAYGTHIHPETGNRINKYPVGVAVFQMPLFFVAHFFALLTYPELIDGYNPDYQRSVSYSTVLFVFLGLLILRKFLLQYLEDKYVWPVLLILGLGTNLYHYTVYDHGLSHSYSFFLFCWTLLLMQRWLQSFKSIHAVLLGFTLGMMMICRPTDILIVILLFFMLISKKAYYQTLFIRKYLQLPLVIFFMAIPVFLQLLYWKYTTGSWVYYSYGEEGFNFRNPNIINGLFSYRKGWFVYSPLVILGFIGTFFLFMKRKEEAIFPYYGAGLLIFYAITWFVVFSWWMWFYGGSFGSRVMIETYPILALPIGLFIEKIYTSGNRLLKTAVTLIIGAGICLNIFQSYQYNLGIIHWDSMNKEMYWERMFKYKHPEHGFSNNPENQ